MTTSVPPNKTSKESSSVAIDKLARNFGLSHNKESIILIDVPIPPSSNNQYKLFTRGNRRGHKIYHVPSDTLKAFRKAMGNFAHFSCPQLPLYRQKAQDWLNKGLGFEVRALFFLNRGRIFTKDGLPKKMDVSNRLKALHDSVSELIGVDDSMFFRIYAEKLVAEHTQEMVIIEISPMEV